jgi:hypothetical protein
MLEWLVPAIPVILKLLTSPRYRAIDRFSGRSVNLLVQPPKKLIMEGLMSGRKPKTNGGRDSIRDSKSPSFRWVNVPLEDTDFDYLERQEATLEQLALDYVQLATRGFGTSVKYDPARKSFNCCIYGSSAGDDSDKCGLSGHSPDLRDALLVTLYRFDIKLQGEFPAFSSDSTIHKSRRFG